MVDIEAAMARLADALQGALSLTELWTAYDGHRSDVAALRAAVEASVVAFRDVRTALGPKGGTR